MTLEQLEKLSDREIDALVAERVTLLDVRGKALCMNIEGWSVLSTAFVEAHGGEPGDGYHSVQPVYLVAEHWREVPPDDPASECCGVNVSGLSVVPFYSTDGNAMLEVVEKLKDHAIRISNKTAQGYWWIYMDVAREATVQCTSLPRGVCIAALLAVQKANS